MEIKITKMTRQLSAGLIIALLTLGNVFAQTTGNIIGKVKDDAFGEFLPGAYVALENTEFKTITSTDGKYAFYKVPPGTYKIAVSYMGYDDYSEEVIVPENGGTVKHKINMAPSLEILTNVVVKGNRFGQTKALNAQKEAVNIKNVISEEEIDRFPDLNTAEVLQRVSGVTIQRDMGEGRFIALRGTSPQMTNVTVNGEQIATSNGERRVVELDVISAEQLAGIEVTKVITPDMDGNAIGGSVNLRTRSAFDVDGTLLTANIGGGKSGLVDNANFRSAMDFSKVFGANKKFGFSFSSNFARTSRERQNNEHKWGDRDDVNDNKIPMALRNTEIQSSKNQRDRLGLNSRLEYKFNDNNRIYVSGMYNFRWDDQNRQKYRVRVDKGDYISATEVQDTRFLQSLHDRVETQKVTSFNLGGEHQLGKLKVDYLFSTSSAFTKKDDGQLKPEFQLKGVDVRITDINSKTPGWIVTNDIDTNDGDNYKFDVIDEKFEDTNNTITTSALNLTLPLLLGSNTGELKFGGKYRTNNKDRKDLRSKWKWEGDEDLLLSQFEAGTNDVYIQDGAYNLGRPLDRTKFRNFFNANKAPGKFEESVRNDVNLGEPYEAKEDITGLYVMTTQTYGKLLVLAGVRTEFTNLDYTATNLIIDRDDIISAEQENVKRSYNFVFPNLQFRYRISDNTNIRLAYSKGIAPPNFFDAMPYSTVDLDNEEIIAGNPDLNPTEANNFDLLGEHFFKGIGILSGGVYYKKLNQFNFQSRGKVSGGDYDGYDIRQFVNGDGADLLGIELSWQQQFTFLPGFLGGFGIYANYTYTNTSNIDLGPDTERPDIDLLPYQMEHVGNTALTYENGGLTARISANFSGKFIEEVGEDADNDEWRDKFIQLDFSSSYRIGKGFDIFLLVTNITNEPRYNYWGVTTRAKEHGINGTSFDAGIKWTL